MISELVRPHIQKFVLALGHALARLGVSANLLTVIGLVLNLVVAVVIAAGQVRWGGALLLIASAFDTFDGAVARATNTTTRFGGFLDATLDRYSETVVFGGLLFYLLRTDDARIGALLVFAATVGALLISYARARAEAVGYSATVGLVARTERVIILAICLLIGQPVWALWFLAVTTHLTAITRVIHVWRLSKQESPDAAGRAAPGVSARGSSRQS